VSLRIRAILTAVVCVVALGGAGSAGSAPTDVFFSEYIEGTSNNKALEIFNGTAAAIDLGAQDYFILMHFNGSPGVGLTIELTGTVAAGDVYVVTNAAAAQVIRDAADQITTSTSWFNGDDAVILRKGGTTGTVVDAIGQVGFDPGTEWGSGLTSTADNTLRRKPGIESGDANFGDTFDPAVEWDGFATDTFDGLGSHGNPPPSLSCGGPLTTEAGTPATRSVSAQDPDGRVVDIAITSVSPSPAPGSVTVSNLVPAAASGGTATADITVDGATPPGSYSVAIRATNDDASPQTGTCTLSVVVDAAPVPIYELQGDGDMSSYDGTSQTTTGVVTVIVGNGFFMQDAAGDGDPATSDGIFVFGGSFARAVAPGDVVRVSGTIDEFRPSSRPRDLTLTEFSPTASVVKTGTAAVPAPVVIADRPDVFIDPDGIETFERLEGMYVSISTPRVSGPTNSFGEFVVAASGDHANMTPGGNFVLRPLMGGGVDYNPERIMVDDEARLPGGTGSGTRINNPQPALTVGDTATGNVLGALDYQFSNYRVQASNRVADVITGSPAPGAPVAGLRDPQPWEGRISSFNVENLFDCVDAPGKSDDHPTCNATALAALETQLSKLADAFERELEKPELVIIEETENTAVLTGDSNGFVPGTTLPALLPRVSGNWDAVSFDASDERGIEVAFVFNTDRVTLHDAFLATDVLLDGGLFSGSPTIRSGREPLVGVFTLDDVDVTVIGNHLKSKGGPQFGVDPVEAGDDPLYGAFQPPVRWTEVQLRHAQADYVRDLVDHLLASDPDARIVVGGDLNDFHFGEPGEGQHTVARITDSPTASLTNVVPLVPEAQQYTFIFEGNSQVLDHLLLNAPMEALRSDQAIGHFNTDYPDAFGPNAATTVRSSDHDPLVAYFCTDLTPPSLSVSLDSTVLWPPNHKYRTVRASWSVSDDRDPDPSVELVSVTSSEPDEGLGDEDVPNDIVVVDESTFRLRAERSDTGPGRMYTITYRATDACGNETTAPATVLVPHNQGVTP
jgi:predicted extracellular nuclease